MGSIDIRPSGARRLGLSVVLILGAMTPARPQTAPQTDPPLPNASARSVHPRLNLRELAEPLQSLTPAEHQLFDDAVKQIKQNHHAFALEDLSRLIASNPKNSALRVLRAYLLLELGNVTGALDEARIAEESGGHSAYRCWFLAQVAYLAGNAPLCRREIKHIGDNPKYGSSAEKLGRKLDTAPKP